MQIYFYTHNIATIINQFAGCSSNNFHYADNDMINILILITRVWYTPLSDYDVYRQYIYQSNIDKAMHIGRGEMEKERLYTGIVYLVKPSSRRPPFSLHNPYNFRQFNVHVYVCIEVRSYNMHSIHEVLIGGYFE